MKDGKIVSEEETVEVATLTITNLHLIKIQQLKQDHLLLVQIKSQIRLQIALSSYQLIRLHVSGLWEET